MVEELKLAIKVDDDSIEQSLLKQFANAEKMANKVVLTFNNIDLDDKAVEAKFKEMQKMAGKNPIDLSIDKSSIEMLSAISKQLGNIFDIAKGKSIIDSSATVAEINKITQATKELNKVQTGSENIQSKSFTTKNKTEAYNQLKQTADVFKQFYGNEEAMHTKAGTEAAYAYYKAYEEALRKGVAESKLQKVTVDVDKDGFFNAERISSTRIEEFANFEKYGGEVTALSEEISYFEKRLLKFSDAYSQIQSKLGKAPITPEIIQNIEEYVRNLEIAESRAKDADLMGFTKEDIDIYKDSVNMYLGFAIEDAIKENEKYISSLKEVSEEKEKVDVSLNKSQTSDMDSSVVEQQNKIQEELKETQKQAEQTSESLSKIGDVDKSNISSENSIVESQNKIQEELKETDESIQKILYHYGLLSSYNGGKKSHQFGDEVTAYKEGKSNGGRGWADGTGTYVTNDATEFSKITTTEDFKKFFALDASKLKMYEAHIEEEAKKFYEFQHKLEQFVLALGSGYTGFDDNISDVTSESLYAEAKSVFAKYPEIFNRVFKDFEDFDAFIDKMINLVSESGMNENGFESKNARKLMEFKKNNGIDDIKTRFLKELGFQGTDLSGTSYGGIQSGSVIFDIDTAPIIASGKTIQEVLDAIGVKAENTIYKVREVTEVKSDSPIKDVFQGGKIDQATTSAKELDKALEQVDIPTDSFDDVLSKLDLTKSELKEIVKITKQSVSDSEGKFHDSYTLKDKRGSTEIYGLSSNTEKGQLLRSNIVGYDAKEIEQEAKVLNQAWEEANKVNNALNETKNILSSLPRMTELDTQFSSLDAKLSSLNGELTSGKISVADYKKEVKSLTSEYSKLVTIQQNRDVETYNQNAKAAEQEAKAIESMNNELEAYNKQVPKKPADGQRSDKFEGLIQNYKNAISEAQKYLNNLGDSPVTEEIKKEWENLISVIKKAKEEMDSIPTAERGSDALSRGKEIDTITKYLNKFTGISKQAKRELNGLLDQLQSGDPSVNVKKIHERFLELTVAEREAGREARNLFDIFKDKKIYSFLGQAASMFSFYDIINVARQAGEAVIDLNTNITELAKVSEASASQIYDNFNSYADIAKEVGGTISDTISATADWSRNGYNIPDAKELAEVAMIYKNVGDGIDIDQANEYLISTLRGFSLEAKDAMDIIDSINEVANNEPISSAGIGEALQRSAAAFNVANTSLQESIALVTSTNSVLQSPEKVGSMWTTVSARIRGAKTELEDAGLETDGMVESTSKLQAMIKGMTGFDILEDDQKTFKSIYDIIIGIGEEFQNLSGVDQAALLEALAGKRQSNALAATLNNIDLLKKAYGEATNAEGSAMAEQKKYQQSIQYSIDRTKASLEELANDFISSDFLKGLIDSGDKLINILDLLIDKFGVLGTTAIVGGGILGANNLGKTYKYMVFKYNCFEYALHA